MNTEDDILKNVGSQIVLVTIAFGNYLMDKNTDFSKYLVLSFTEIGNHTGLEQQKNYPYSFFLV